MIEVATAAEAAAALAALSEADLLRLERFARFRALGLVRVEWADLLQDALERVLAGSRQWPRHIRFIVFLLQTIRSVASEERRQQVESPVAYESDLHADDADPTSSLLQSYSDPSAGPEREVAARVALKQIEQLFSDDPVALAVLAGLADGCTPQEVQTTASMTPTQYASAQRRIRRTLVKAANLKEI